MGSLFNQDYLYHLASKHDLRPSKKYGQNYLIDEEVINKILEVASVSKKDTVVEVGPGFGVLTFPLAERAGKVVSFEIEKKLQPYWNEKLIQYKNIELVWGNVLREFKNSDSRFKNYKVVANLPYQVTSAVIRLFLEAENPPETMTLMVQKEVAERICAEPGDMSLLAVSVQYYADPKLEFIVPRTAFWPSPQVDSAVITVKQKNRKTEKQIDVDVEKFFDLVKAGFANRRKLLLKNLEPYVKKSAGWRKEKLKQTFDDLGLLPTARAQELSVEQWKELSSLLSTYA